MSRFTLSVITICLLMFISICNHNSPSLLSKKIIDAHKSNSPIPLISSIKSNLSIDAAYKIQNEYVKRRLNNEQISGFKAGITSVAGQKKFKISEAVSGVLFASGHAINKTQINSDSIHNMKIEAEIGFSISQDIKSSIKDTIQLMFFIDSIMPVIELPDLYFENINDLKAIDIIASNIASGKYIIAAKSSIESIDSHSLSLTLTRNERQLIIQNDILKGHKEMALWLINSSLENGYSIKKGHIIITGAQGEIINAEKGNYLANYNNLGYIEFEIK
ncbi:MAG: hypothetical protein JEZ03_01305 [Bacteroidales bacterium]|nr:hypothetical protein [Bacteroidales bacterium]